MIVITGATGRLGSAVVAALLDRVPEEEVRLSTTAPDRLGDLAARGVQVVRGDYDDPASLTAAFEGADRLLVVSAPRIGDAAVAAHRAVIDAATAAGVGHLLYTSHVGSDPLSPFPPAVTHATTEVLLRESGLPFTALRSGFYADTPLRLLRGAAETGELRVPADAPVSWTVREDLGPAIAALLTAPVLEEPAVTLTAGEALDMAHLVTIAADVLQRPIAHVVVGDGEYVDGLLAAGVPQMGAAMSLGIFQASRQRRLGITDPALERLIGRPSARLRDLLALPSEG